MPPCAFTTRGKSFVGGKRAGINGLRPYTILHNTIHTRCGNDALREDIIMRVGTYLSTGLVLTVNINLLRREYHLSHKVGFVALGDGDIDIARVVIVKGSRRGDESPTAVVVANIITESVDTFHIYQYRGGRCTVGIEIVFVAGGVELNPQGGCGKPVV